ncbi:MAG: hypothetical protein ACR2G3_08525 [Solirubrobacterales bacterium]
MDAEREQTQAEEEWIPPGAEPRRLTPPPGDEIWDPPPPRPRSTTRVSRPGAQAGGQPALDLNVATFETLRATGLSVTQANRFLRRREVLGGFTSLAQIDELDGFPRDLKRLLRSRGRV